MTAFYIQLYEAMLGEVQSLKKKGMQYRDEIETCYQIGVSYWNKLQMAVDDHIFSNTSDEINFFKNIKPLFVSEIEYYRLVYWSELFRPIDMEEEGLKDFWLKEVLRLRSFCKENLSFYRYYRSGHTYLDDQFFLRKNCDEVILPETNLYKMSCKNSSSHDHLVCTLLTLERYSTYAREQIVKHASSI